MVRTPEGERERRLQQDVERLRSEVRSLQTKLQERVTERFQERLQEEAKRSQRYNHFFSVIVLRSEGTSAQAVYERLKPRLRSTDIVELIDGSDEDHARGRSKQTANPTQAGKASQGRRVTAILPETDGIGARVAVDRVKTFLYNMRDMRLGLAVYPDDSTNWGQLLWLADASA